MLKNILEFKCCLIYLVFNFILAVFVHKQCKKVYGVQTESTMDPKIHQKYPEWNRLDKLSFLRIYIGLVFLFWARLIISLILLIFDYICIRLMRIIANEKSDLHKRNLFMKINYYFCSILLFILGMRTRRIQSKYPEIYKKYLGPDYCSNFDDNYSIIISNHLSWMENFYYMKIFSPGFIAKDSVKNVPWMGYILTESDSLFIDRTNFENRTQVAEQIKIRQESFLNRTNLTPLFVFPEGTLTNGKYILKFKRGAFQSLLPVKPMIMRTDKDPEAILCFGAIKIYYHLVIAFSYLYHEITFEEIPVITPTDYMFENYSHLGNEKWEIYAEVVRSIYCEIAGFKKSNKSYNDLLDYMSQINNRRIINT